MSEDAAPVAMATKLPKGLRDAFVALAKRRNLTPSALLRRLVEFELAGRPDDVVGEVEAAVRAEITERYGDLTASRSAAAVNLARRMDRDPTSGAPNAAQLRLLLADLTPSVDGRAEIDRLDALRLSAQLSQRGLKLVTIGGVDVEQPQRADALLEALQAALGVRINR